MRCDECQHWHLEPDGSYRAVKDLGECQKAVELWDATEWTKGEDGEDSYCDRIIKPALVGQMSFVQDDSDYSAHLWTRPEFFCAHFASRL